MVEAKIKNIKTYQKKKISKKLVCYPEIIYYLYNIGCFINLVFTQLNILFF